MGANTDSRMDIVKLALNELVNMNNIVKSFQYFKGCNV